MWWSRRKAAAAAIQERLERELPGAGRITFTGPMTRTGPMTVVVRIPERGDFRGRLLIEEVDDYGTVALAVTKSYARAARVVRSSLRA